MKSINTSPEYFMQQALHEAQLAKEQDEVPVGAVVVANNKIIARGHNQVERLTDATAHAELVAITSAFNYFGSKYLENCEIYVTLEPCLMCLGAIKLSRIDKFYFGTYDVKSGFTLKLTKQELDELSFESGIMEKHSVELLHEFFTKKRNLF